MHEIIEYLYLGGLIDATNLDSLKRSNIDAIVCCCTPVELPVSARISEVDYFCVDVEDIGAEPIDSYFYDAANFIDRHVLNKKPVLVHCKSGVSRSATIAMAYLVIKKNFYLQEAFFHVRAKRDVVCPNIGFMSQLCKLETALSEGDEITVPEVSTNITGKKFNSISQGDLEMDNDSACCTNSLQSIPLGSSAISLSFVSSQSDHGESDLSHNDILTTTTQSTKSDPQPSTKTKLLSPHSSSESLQLRLCSPSDSTSQSPISSSQLFYKSESCGEDFNSQDHISIGESFPFKFIDKIRTTQHSPSYPSTSNIVKVSLFADNTIKDMVITQSIPITAANGIHSSIDNSVSGDDLEFTPLRSSTPSHIFRRRSSRRLDESRLDHKSKRLRQRRKSRIIKPANADPVNSTILNSKKHFYQVMNDETTGCKDGVKTDNVENKTNHLLDTKFIDGRSFHQSIRRKGPSFCIDKYIDWYIADGAYRAAVPDLDP